MSHVRKLKVEIEKTLKKVVEGVAVFESIWDEVYAAPDQQEKEKHVVELKKELKKLQRCRDQLKQWISGSTVKDKTELLDARKLIETKMEKFKVCEKETKTKAFSKEGLAQAEEMGPQERAKLSTCGWVRDAVSGLEAQIDEFEAEIEGLSSKNSLHDIEHLEQCIANHKWHIEKLEQTMRLLMNDAVSVEKVEAVREDVIYYSESNQEPDFFANEFMYDDLDLEEAISAQQQQVSGSFSRERSLSISLSVKEKEKGKKAAVKEEVKLPQSPTRAKTRIKAGGTVSQVNVPVVARVFQPPPKESVKPPVTGQVPLSAIVVAGLSPQPQPAPQQPQRTAAPPVRARTEGAPETVKPAAPEPPKPQPVVAAPEKQTAVPAPTAIDSHKRTLERAWRTLPRDDLKSSKAYKPVRPFSTPGFFPQAALAHLSDQRVLANMDLDTLFFIFYFQQGTELQIQAAKQLKRRHWRYHTKYLTWFKRHEEPRVSTETFEQGAYLYFDYESNWCQTLKGDFVFEYCFLEDELES